MEYSFQKFVPNGLNGRRQAGSLSYIAARGANALSAMVSAIPHRGRPIILFTRPQRHARHRAQSIIGVSSVSRFPPRVTIRPARRILPAEPFVGRGLNARRSAADGLLTFILVRRRWSACHMNPHGSAGVGNCRRLPKPDYTFRNPNTIASATGKYWRSQSRFLPTILESHRR
jgi:hypothetical protein